VDANLNELSEALNPDSEQQEFFFFDTLSAPEAGWDLPVKSRSLTGVSFYPRQTVTQCLPLKEQSYHSKGDRI
jgi:hypothetical protein